MKAFFSIEVFHKVLEKTFFSIEALSKGSIFEDIQLNPVIKVFYANTLKNRMFQSYRFPKNFYFIKAFYEVLQKRPFMESFKTHFSFRLSIPPNPFLNTFN